MFSRWLILWMVAKPASLATIQKPNDSIPLQMPTDNYDYAPWFLSGAGFCPSTVGVCFQANNPKGHL